MRRIFISATSRDLDFFESGARMRMSYDREVDALRIIFRDATVTTHDLAEGIAAEYDSQGGVVGLEILDAIQRLGDPSVLQQVIVERLGPASPSAASLP